MDMQMPVMDGVEATLRIRAHEKSSGDHVRIIAMTANALAEDREKCLDAGMDEYLSKPIQIDVLRAALRWQQSSFAPTQPAPLPPDVSSAFSPLKSQPATLMGHLDFDQEPHASSEPSEPAMNASGFDYTEALTRVDALVVSIIGESFRDNWPKQMAQMREGMSSRDAVLVQRAAHTLRGLLGNFGADPATALCRKIEVASAAGDLEGPAPSIELLELEMRDLDVALSNHLKKEA
jgi:HPt (histidine-containing phosphotransfer) domain-containing protein